MSAGRLKSLRRGCEVTVINDFREEEQVALRLHGRVGLAECRIPTPAPASVSRRFDEFGGACTRPFGSGEVRGSTKYTCAISPTVKDCTLRLRTGSSSKKQTAATFERLDSSSAVRGERPGSWQILLQRNSVGPLRPRSASAGKPTTAARHERSRHCRPLRRSLA